MSYVQDSNFNRATPSPTGAPPGGKLPQPPGVGRMTGGGGGADYRMPGLEARGPGAGGPAIQGGAGTVTRRTSAPPLRAGAPSNPTAPITAADPFSQPTSAMDVYRSSVPVMKRDLQDRLSDAMAGAGFSGNRFGSYAMKTAAEEGARTGLEQNQLMTNLLYNQTNRDQDRSLQAAGMATSQEQAANQMQLDRMRFLSDQGRYEQDRQDNFSRMSYDDFERNKLGFLPMLLQMAQAPGTVTQGVWGNQQSGGDPGIFDWAQLAAQFYGAR